MITGTGSQASPYKAHLAGLCVTALCAPATLLLVLAMNRAVAAPENDRAGGEVSFQVQQAPRPKPVKKEPPPPERRAPRSTTRAALPPAPSLGSELSGVDVGLSAFGVDPLETVSDEALGDLGDVVHTEETVDSRPTPRVTTPIEVPPDARARNLSGRVVLSLRIGADGAVRGMKVLESSPPGVFDAVVMAAVRGWEFEPATYRGQPVEVWATLPVEFSP